MDIFVRGIVALERERGTPDEFKLTAEIEIFAGRYGVSKALVLKRLREMRHAFRLRPLPLGKSIEKRGSAYCVSRLLGHLEWLADSPRTNPEWQAVYDESQYLRNFIANDLKRPWWLIASLDQIRQLLAHGNRNQP